MVPQTGALDGVLEFVPAGNGDTIYRYNNEADQYDSYTYFFGIWGPEIPVLRVGESFLINSGTGGDWNRTFLVW
ncbi:MAG: hypothetical protein K9N48_03180 [Verrucomicrobia bacterium]|nr:hypothetical protein [Verrucomicrobiota bacterium]